MGLNVSTAMGFENKEFLKNAAKNILSNSGTSSESASKIINGTIFDYNTTINPQLSVIKASEQISLNKSLDETLKYLKSHAARKSIKAHTFGELWNLLGSSNNLPGDNEHYGELFEITIDMTKKNIFAA